MAQADPFASARAMLANGREHADRFAAVIAVEFPKLVWIVQPEVLLPNNMAAIIWSLESPMPLRWSAITFDVLANLRTALDHAAYASAVVLKGGAPRHTKFPFGDTIDQARADAASWAKDVHPEIVETMLGFEPHLAGNRLLYGLNKLRNTKVHRLLAPAPVNFRHVVQSLPDWVRPPGDKTPRWNHEMGRITLFNYPVNSPLTEVDLDVTLEPALSPEAGAEGMDAKTAFDAMAAMVDEIIETVAAKTAEISRRT